MIYLDYSATTPVNKEVLDSFCVSSLEYVGNANSLHKLGSASHQLIETATEQVQSILHCPDKEVIYTSGSSEANNLALKGVAWKYKNRGQHIITTELEHSSILGPLKELEKQGFIVEYAPLDKDGCVDLQKLKEILREDTILVTIASVSSEVGIRQPIEKIGAILKEYPKCIFHSDMTQSIGKIKLSLENIDLVSFSAHKFYGIKGIGVLLKKNNLMIEPLIHGGKSTSTLRSGTPPLPLIVSLSKAIRLSNDTIELGYKQVEECNQIVREELRKYPNVLINSTSASIPHILNISVLGVKPETMLHALEEHDIYISTQSACNDGSTISASVNAIYHDEKRASSSLRISFSYLTTKEEIKLFLDSFDKCYCRLIKK